MRQLETKLSLFDGPIMFKANIHVEVGLVLAILPTYYYLVVRMHDASARHLTADPALFQMILILFSGSSHRSHKLSRYHYAQFARNVGSSEMYFATRLRS